MSEVRTPFAEISTAFLRDKEAGCAGFMEWPHLLGHSGQMFRAWHKFTGLNSTANADISITVPAGYECHLVPYAVSSTASLDLFLYEGPTITVAGTGITAYCTHRGDFNYGGGEAHPGAVPNPVTLAYSPTVTVTGTAVWQDFKGSASIEKNIQWNDETILKGGTTYLLRGTIGNNSTDLLLGVKFYVEREKDY